MEEMKLYFIGAPTKQSVNGAGALPASSITKQNFCRPLAESSARTARVMRFASVRTA